MKREFQCGAHISATFAVVIHWRIVAANGTESKNQAIHFIFTNVPKGSNILKNFIQID